MLDADEYEKLRNRMLQFQKETNVKSAEHCMVDLTQRLLEVGKLVDEGKYFTINRASCVGMIWSGNR